MVRSESGIFHGKHGLITLRDLFRWAERYRRSKVTNKFYDWEQQLAEDGGWRYLYFLKLFTVLFYTRIHAAWRTSENCR